MTNEQIIAYTAGLVDGEGTITLTRITRGKQRAPCVTVSSTTIELLNFMKEHYGGTIVKLRHVNAKWKQAWHWQVSYNRAVVMLKEITPYLLEPSKRRRAELIIRDYKSVTPRNGKYTPELLEARAAFDAEFFREIQPIIV